jgi:anti-anti-sigma factor
MPELQCRYLLHRLEEGVLVLTFSVNQLQDEKISEGVLQELSACIDNYQARKVVIDLRHIKYISSVAFRPLLHVRRKLQEAGGRLVLCGLNRLVGDVFYTTRLVSAGGATAAPFDLEQDVAAAIARLNAPPPASQITSAGP